MTKELDLDIDYVSFQVWAKEFGEKDRRQTPPTSEPMLKKMEFLGGIQLMIL